MGGQKDTGYTTTGSGTGDFEPAWKVVPQHGLKEQIAFIKKHFGLIAATGGCFDLIHPGHIRQLQWAARRGILVVLLNSDFSVRNLKGAGRPVQDFSSRAEVLSGLSCVDYIVSFDEPTPEAVLELVRPDIWVKSQEYRGHELPEREVVERHGGGVLFSPHWSGFSTSELVKRITEGHNGI